MINPKFLEDELEDIFVAICTMRGSLPSESTGYESSLGSRWSWLRIGAEKENHFCLMTDEVVSMRPPSRSEIAQIHAKFASTNEEIFNIWWESHAVSGET
jgi:hypothetical protein